MDYIKTIDSYLKSNLSNKRYTHSRKVADMAGVIALKCGLDTDMCYLAGLSHDIARELSLDSLKEKVYNWGTFSDEFYSNSCLYHGPVGALILKEKFGINDYEIQEAVAYHSIGNINMCNCSKVVYVADYISLDRLHIDNVFRDKVLSCNLDQMVFMVVKETGRYLNTIGLELIPESRNMFLKLKEEFNEEKKGF